jgi:hypothetical protein
VLRVFLPPTARRIYNVFKIFIQGQINELHLSKHESMRVTMQLDFHLFCSPPFSDFSPSSMAGCRKSKEQMFGSSKLCQRLINLTRHSRALYFRLSLGWRRFIQGSTPISVINPQLLSLIDTPPRIKVKIDPRYLINSAINPLVVNAKVDLGIYPFIHSSFNLPVVNAPQDCAANSNSTSSDERAHNTTITLLTIWDYLLFTNKCWSCCISNLFGNTNHNIQFFCLCHIHNNANLNGPQRATRMWSFKLCT